MLIFHRGARVDGTLWLIGSLLVLCGLLALLPQQLFSVPGWRKHLLENGAVPLAATVSTVPRETCFWLAVLALAVATGIFTSAHPIRSAVQLVLAVTASAVCAVYAGLAIYAKKSGWHYPFDFDSEFDFPSTNNTSTLLLTGAIVALGVIGVAFRRRHSVAERSRQSVWPFVPRPCFFLRSRGRILFLGGGTLLWLCGLGRAHRSKPMMICFAAIFASGVLLFLNAGSQAQQRMFSWARSQFVESTAPEIQGGSSQKVAGSLPLDARLLIFRDTLGMIRDFPVTGTGLGTFRYDFPAYRERYVSDAICIHPESDWLMLAAEAGVPALFIMAVAIILLVFRIRPLQSHPYWPLRWGLACAALAAVLHGLIDTPVHRIALGWWVLSIAGIGFQTALGKRRSLR